MSESEAQPMPVTSAAQDPDNLNDGRTFAYLQSEAYVALSPNSDFVPEPPIGLVRVYLCKDFRYGVHDPIQWPQAFSDEFDYLCAVRRRNPVDEAILPRIWDSPREGEDFEILEGTIFKTLGLLSKTWFGPLEKLVEELATEVHEFAQDRDAQALRLRRTMLDARDRVIHFPSTFRDACMQLRTVQRYWLMCRAYVDFRRLIAGATSDTPMPVDTRLMGAFTPHPAIVQRLYRAGIPVWHIRPSVNLDDIVVDALVTAEQPQLVSEPFESGASAIYSGLVGTAMFEAVSRRAYLYLDVSRTPLLVRYDQQSFCTSTSETPRAGRTGGARTSVPAQHGGRERPGAVIRRGRQSHAPYQPPHPSQVRGRDKFIDPVHAWMPERLRAWDLAMKSVDRSGLAKRQDALWGYWIPEPALLLGPQDVERTRRYLMNWLRVRAPWLYLLAHPDAGVTRVPPQWWRDFLNGEVEGETVNNETRRARRLEQVKKVFDVAFAQDTYAATNRPVEWFTCRIAQLPPNLCSLVVWEVHEIGFRYELLALDRVLVPCRNDALGESVREELLSRIFPDHSLYYLRTLPQKPVGLSAELPHARVRHLEAFRQVLLRWPLCPQAVHAADPLALTTPASRIEDLEVAMTTFYVQTFFAYSGRAPIVPHALPVFRGLWPGSQ